MNRFSTRSTDKPKRLRLLCLCAAFWSAMGLSCVSQPRPATHDAPHAAAEPAPPAAPEVVGLSRPKVTVAPARAALAEPELRPPVPAAPQPRPSVDITVLSASPTITFAPVRLPEPTATPAATPTAISPAAKPVASPTPVAPKASAPAAATPEAAAPAATPAPQPGQTAVLPAAPTSSARIEAAARPVAETKMETARGERFELRFPGSGWIYLGDEQGKEGLRYETRRFEDNAAVFAMNPDQVGEYLLRFQRQNPVDRSTEVSLVRVIVVDKPSFSSTPSSAVSSLAATAAPSTPTTSAQSQAAAQSEAQPAAPPGSQPSTQAAVQPSAQSASPLTAQPASPGIDLQSITDPSELIKRARDELDAKRVQAAIDALDRYLSLYPYGIDEVYYLYGLAYEQDTPFRNIKKSYDAYRRVRDEYPRSSRWKDAAERMAYFEKHYLGLR